MNARPASKARTFGWIVLLLVGLALIVEGLASTYVAYLGSNTAGSDPHIDKLRAVSPELAKAAQARRGTAAATAAAFGLLFCFVATTAFRRGERWAWWAALASTVVGCLLILLRVPLLDTTLGTGAAAVWLVLVLLGTLVSVKDFFSD